MARPKNGDPLSCIAAAILPEYIRHAVCDPSCRFSFSDRQEAVRSRGIRRKPSPRRIDDSICSERFWTPSILISKLKGGCFASFGFQFVITDAADRGNPARRADDFFERRAAGERFQI